MTRELGVFIGQRRDRIGARLLMILTCIRLSQDYGTDYRVNWFPQGADAPELNDPSELFSEQWMAKHFLGPRDFSGLNEDAAPIWQFQNDVDSTKLEAHIADGRAIIVEEGFEVLAFPWEDTEAIRNRYDGLIKQIGFSKDIQVVMANVDRALAGRSVVAYHIRRGDILNTAPWKHSTWPAKIEPEEYYEAHLAQSAKRPAIMFSDQPELLAKFQSKFPHLITMSDFADLTEMPRAQRDFLELYTMSRADQIVAPIISAFSMAAARISGRQRLVFRDVLSETELAEANSRVIKRVAQGPNAFLNPSEAAHIYAKAAQNLNSRAECETAYDLARPIFDAGANNAFLYVLQAINCFYLGRWAECGETARRGLAHAGLWPEDHAVLLALRAAALGAQKKRWAAGLELARAFWAKPMQRDVVVLASRMLYRDQLASRLFPPVDWELQKAVRRRLYTPFSNLTLVQHLVIKRRPCNFDMLLLDWSELALDQKAQRLLGDQDRLANLRNSIDRVPDPERFGAAYWSLDALLSYYQQRSSVENSIDAMRRVVSAEPAAPLYHKRLADLFEAAGDFAMAAAAHDDAMTCAPDNPFIEYCRGQFDIRSGSVEKGQDHILHAADLAPQCATIHGEAGHIMLRRGEFDKAMVYLQRAHELCPAFKRFKNQMNRISKNSGGKERR